MQQSGQDETFEGVGDPAEQKTILEPPADLDFEPDDLDGEEPLPIDEQAEPRAEDPGLAL